jgi:heme/copper-type cytochrome/quinol oxidase subunit 4
MDTTLLSKQFELFMDKNTRQNNSGILFVYLTLFILSIIICIMLYYLSTEKNILESDTLVNIYFVAIPAFILLWFLYFRKSETSKIKSFGILLGVLVGIYGIIYLYQSLQNLGENTSYFLNIFLVILTIGIILFGLSIYYNLFSDRIRRLTGITGFVVNFIMYIPCLISDFIEYLRNELNVTPSAVYILLFIEILLIVLYVYIPQLLQKKLIENGEIIRNKPIFLNKKYTLANGSDLPKSKYKKDKYNYSLSFWSYINVNAPSEIRKNIISYGNITDGYKPKIEYIGTNHSELQPLEDSKKDKYIITFGREILDSDTGEPKILGHEIYIDVPGQKWNNFVFNCDQNVIDIFLNGELMKTLDVGDSVPTFGPQDKITAGDDLLEGSICNVVYYNKKMTKSEISSYYNLLLNKNPPVNNII